MTEFKLSEPDQIELARCVGVWRALGQLENCSHEYASKVLSMDLAWVKQAKNSCLLNIWQRVGMAWLSEYERQNPE